MGTIGEGAKRRGRAKGACGALNQKGVAHVRTLRDADNLEGSGVSASCSIYLYYFKKLNINLYKKNSS